MDKKRLGIALKVLGRVKEEFPDTKKFIEDLIDEECQKEKIPTDEMWKGAEVKKAKRLTHKEIKKQLIKSIVINDTIETDELNKKAEEVRDPKKVAEVIQECENIIQRRKA